jgi:SNF2 family DNA or RNA helicase
MALGKGASEPSGSSVSPGPVLVAYQFKHDLARLRARFPTLRTLDGPAEIDAWNAGEFGPGEILAAHTASAGHGLNLQDGGSTVVWFSLTWSLEQYQQFNARLHRQGQTRTVVVHHLIARGTVDETVIAALESKATGQDALLDALRFRASTHRQGLAA